MLTALTIKNVVLIESLLIEFDKGFCALTGETGAGKSILLDSLGLALGARAETSLVRHGTDQASVTAEFFLPDDHPAFAVLRDNDIDVDENDVHALVLRRSVTKDGRSRAFINDAPVSVGLLNKLGQEIVEIHGQFETQGLLDVKTHQGLLDGYAGIHHATLSVVWDKWRQAMSAYEQAKADMEKASEEEEYLRFSLKELDEISPQDDEEGSLTVLRDKLMHRDQLIECLNAAMSALSGDDGADRGLSSAWRALDKIVVYGGQTVKDGLDAVNRATSEVQEATAQLQSALADVDESEYNLQEIDERLFALRGLAKKHKCSIADLIEVREAIGQKLSILESQDTHLDDLAAQVSKAKQEYKAKAIEVSHKRKAAAKDLDGLIGAELPPLKLDKARFVTDITAFEDDEGKWNAKGIDQIRFLVATNPGQEPGLLHKVASGGEMSRFMLAIKVIMAQVGTVPTFIFDEVDTGIGGSTAAAVGERLERLSKERQILVVTHAPQVAARADNHYIVHKSDSPDGTVQTSITALDDDKERREEIARMLSGEQVTEEARGAAGKLLETGT